MFSYKTNRKLKPYLFACFIGFLLLLTFENLKHDTTRVEIVNDDDKNANLPTIVKAQSLTLTKPKQSYNLNTQFPNLLKCRHSYNEWQTGQTVTGNPTDEVRNTYRQPASNETHKLTVTRGVVVYFPIKSIDYFQPELKWMYRSWIEMQKYEPKRWRTDLIVFLEKDEAILASKGLFFKNLNCTFTNIRTSENDAPMCTLIEFVTLPKRKILKQFSSYERLLNDLNIFSQNDQDLDEFYSLLNGSLNHYGYLNSILMAFDGYKYFKSAGFDYLIRSDLDVFLTPLFGAWLPVHCNDFITGSGGFSTDFNRNRLKRIAENIGMASAKVGNLGSTWISTPEQFRLVSYYTLFGMAYLSQEEFAKPERDGAIGTLLWPDWHYGVLLLLGQSLGLNHLIATRQINVVKLEGLIDYGTGNVESIHSKLHIHVFHGGDMFSKLAFKAGSYDNMTVNDEDSHKVKYYALKMALEGKRLAESQLVKDLKTQFTQKTLL
jgi:hypothetical protein